MKLYQKVATCLNAMENCVKSGNDAWLLRHEDEAERLTKEYMPSGSGIDSGISIDLDRSTCEKLVFNTSFHHMDENGCYSGWTEHTITVRPSLQFGIDIKISGRDRNDIKDYLGDVFYDALTSEVSDVFRLEKEV